MFDIKDQYNVVTTLPVIRDNYRVLHFDEYPILFSGTNKYGNILLSSLASEEDDIFRYFTIELDDKQYSDFINRKVSYRELIRANQEVFVVDKDINDFEIATYQVPLNDIPSDYLPHPNSYIPEQLFSSSLNFTFSLKGKLADLHKAFVYDVNSVSEKIYAYLKESLESLSHLALNPLVYSQPSKIGSYQLNFDIEFEQRNQMEMFPIDQEKVKQFINQYLNYITYRLPDEEGLNLGDITYNSEAFRKIKDTLIDVYEGSGRIPPQSTMDERLIENIQNSAIKLSDVTEYLKSNKSFNTIELGHYSEEGNFSSIGVITDDYKDAISSKLFLEDELLLESADVEADETQKDYRILVYSLNRESGNGRAKLYLHDEVYNRIILHVHRGENELSNSVYTKSLDEDKVVDVKGIATKVAGIYKKLDCYLK
ncbi:hypothetical protein [Mucilaginibacter sp. HD30]